MWNPAQKAKSLRHSFSIGTRKSIIGFLSFIFAVSIANHQVFADEAKLLNVSYDVTREFYQEYNKEFAAHWKEQTGNVVALNQSHGGSSKQARSVSEGLEADVITMNQPLDIDILHERGNLIPQDWSSRLPNKSVPYNSTILFVVRKGNPKNILAATNVVATTNVAFTFASAGPVALSSSLTKLVVTENQTATFAVSATGQAPYNYQWRSNGVPLLGQTSSTLSFTALWNSGANYSVVVSNEFSSVTSSPPATLSVLPDTSAPQLVGLRGFAGTLNEIVLTFSKPVDPTTATTLSTYSVLTPGLTLQGASISSNHLQVVLATSAQANGQTNQIQITNLKDQAHVPNSLTVAAQFVSGISYRDEVLAENPVRYWTFDETTGSTLGTLVSKFDTDPLSLLGTINNDDGVHGTVLGAPGLVPNVPNDTAFQLNSGNTTNGSVDLPNGKDLTAILGPWSKITHIFSFKADRLPRINGTNTEAPAIYGHGYVAFYLYGTQDTNNPNQALLVFKANNTSSDGPGAPWGGNATNTAKYITYPVVAGQVYNVVGVVDGNATFTGQLRLYINGTLVGTVTGVGEIYKHPNNPPAFGHSFFTTVYGTAYTIEQQVAGNWADPFHGVVDEFAVINNTLSAGRISQLYSFSQTGPAPTGFTIINNPGTSAPTLGSTFSPGSLNLSWPVSGDGYYLEYTTNLSSGIWFSNPVAPGTVSGFNVITQSINGGGSKFFRLRHP